MQDPPLNPCFLLDILFISCCTFALLHFCTFACHCIALQCIALHCIAVNLKEEGQAVGKPPLLPCLREMNPKDELQVTLYTLLDHLSLCIILHCQVPCAQNTMSSAKCSVSNVHSEQCPVPCTQCTCS